MTLDDTAQAVTAKINEVNQKIREINNFMSMILFKVDFQGQTLEWPEEIEQTVYEMYQTARGELIVLVNALPP